MATSRLVAVALGTERKTMTAKIVRTVLSGGCVLLGQAALLAAEELRFDTQWRDWSLPLGIIELDATGAIRPVEVRKNIDPVRNAAVFGGGIHAAGSNAAAAVRAIDGDPFG